MQPYMGLGNSLQTAQGGAAGGIGGWVELGRTVLGSTSNNFSVDSLANKRYYMVLGNGLPSSGMDMHLRVGNGSIDTGSNYAKRENDNGGSDNTGTSIGYMTFAKGSGQAWDVFGVGHISNLSGKEKLLIANGCDTGGTGAGNIGNRRESACKWANTSNPIDTIGTYNTSGNFAAGSEVVILGWDPADTHTSNFWEELASVELGSAGDNLSSGTITAKKYLWVQAYCIASGAIDMKLTWNNVSTSTYAQRRSINGGADATATSQANVYTAPDNTNYFLNMFFVNDGSNEPLGMIHAVHQNTAGAATAPQRSETVCKNSNTTQITEIDIDNSAAGSFDTGSIIKVYGSD